ncbi:MAG: MAPEG family protein [Alphaproteobacteria bacterium]
MTLLTLLLIWALFAQVGLTIFVLNKMRQARFKAFAENKVTKEQIAVDHSAWPVNVRQIQNSYNSQFELPILFYLATILVLLFGLESWVFVILAWAFIISRIIHMVVHTNSNTIKHRFRAFVAGLFCVVLQWIYIVGMTTLAYLQSL